MVGLHNLEERTAARRAELMRSAEAAARSRRRRRVARQRVGWVMVSLGLRLAVGRAEPRRVARPA